MARKKKSNGEAAETTETVATPAENGVGHNGPPAELTEEQNQKFALQWLRQYEPSLAAKNKAASDHSNLCKRMKTEMGKDAVNLMKDMIAARSEDGELELRARIERAMLAARYMAVPMGSQMSLFDDADRMPAEDRAYAEGKRDGMLGAPHSTDWFAGTPQLARYMDGYSEGQAVIFHIHKPDDAPLFDAPPIGSEESTYTETEATH